MINQTELMLFITPHIISNTDDSNFVTEQFKKKLGILNRENIEDHENFEDHDVYEDHEDFENHEINEDHDNYEDHENFERSKG
jgi:hypothetical protein